MLKRGKLLTIMVGLLIFSVLLTSCQALGLGDQEPDQEVLETSAAQTLAALQTQTAEAMPTNTPEPTPTPPPTDTPMPTATPEPTEDVDQDFIVYTFAENLCQAGWESSVEENIPCPSEEDFDQGFVQPIESANLEDGNTYEEPAMLTYPNSGRGGYMVGRYPDLTIEEGDHFRSLIGCQFGAEACDVRYTLRIARTGEGLDRLGMWHEVYEGLFNPIDVDLSDYTGKEVEVVLSIIAADDTDENFALWLDPRVVREED